jgi:predicted amidohydrolase
MFTPVTATAISIKPRRWEKARNADKIEQFFREAASDGPDLILTTEGVLEGYVVNDVLEGRRTAKDMLEIAEPIHGPYIDRFRRLAQELSTCLCFGFAERIGRDVYNTAIFIGGEGDILGKYHKTQLAEGADPSWNFNRVGEILRAFDTPLGRVGMLICNDRWNPMIARTLALDGARLLLIPSYGSRSRDQNRTVLARARENGLPIVEANVGMNLIVSKGEIVAYKWGNDRITTAVVEVPAPPSPGAARAYETEYMKLQGPEMARRHSETMKRLRGEENEVERAARGELIAGGPTGRPARP